MDAIDKQPLVSIITPVFNGAKYLDELIRSVLEQDYPHVEHIVIDDGSTDNGATVAILKRYPHLRWWSRENKGQYATQNEGLAAAQGSIVGVICADDKYVAPSTLSSVVRYWNLHPECGCVYGRTLRMDSDGNPLSVDGDYRRKPFPVWLLRYRLFLSHCSLFVSRQLVLDKSIWFDTSFRYFGDWDWIIRLSMAGQFGYLDQPLSVYREHPGQTTQQVGMKLCKLETRRILQKNKSSPVLCWLLVSQHRILKGLWILRNYGLHDLRTTVKDWLSRH
jgi:glycosyltransferase involved in cell wall biosynthesis